MPSHQNLDRYLQRTLSRRRLTEGKVWLFRSAIDRSGQLSKNPMRHADVYWMLLISRKRFIPSHAKPLVSRAQR